MQPIFYIGADDFSAAILTELHTIANIEIIGVGTYPDRPHGRGHKLHPTPVKSVAQKLNIPVMEIADVGDVAIHNRLSATGVPVAVLVSFKIVPDEFLSAFPKGIVNLHPSLLPDLRGAAPINWAIMLGYKKSGISTFVISSQLDAGEILLQKDFVINDDETASELRSRLVKPGAELLARSLVGYLSGEIIPRKQRGEPMHRAPKIKKKHRIINWHWDAQKIHNRIRGLSEIPSALTSINGRTIKLLRSKMFRTDSEGTAGRIVDISDEGILVQAGDGIVALLELQPEGSRRMSAREFARGYIKDKSIKFE